MTMVSANIAVSPLKLRLVCLFLSTECREIIWKWGATFTVVSKKLFYGDTHG
jgi:hypothetical protein